MRLLSASSRRLATGLAALLLGAAACTDAPTAPKATGERTGTIQVPAGRAAFVLTFSPAEAVDSVFVGPPSTAPGAYDVIGPVDGRVLVYSDGVIAPIVKFRVFTNAPLTRALVTETSTETGDVDDGATTRLVLLP